MLKKILFSRKFIDLFKKKNKKSKNEKIIKQKNMETNFVQKLLFSEKFVELCIGLKQSQNKDLIEHSSEVSQIVRIILKNLKNTNIQIDNKTKRILEYIDLDTLADIYELHDLGKLFIPDNILNAPRRLTEEEYKVIQNHPLFTERFINCILLQSVNKTEAIKVFYEAVLLISNEHHENYDGTGYPNKLKGNNISLLGRIARVADVISALMGNRCYNREFNSFESIENYLQKNKSVLFDPDIVDIVVGNSQDSKEEKNLKKKRILDIFDCKIPINETIQAIVK